ncbi:hypothetical protein GMSM_05610 [Geomonas sp. Red276]
MAKELYVGSLSYETTEYDLEKLFSVSGRVTSVHLIRDTQTGRFMGCGYVRMSTDAEAKDAILSLDGALLHTKPITVSIANPQKQKNQGGYKGKKPAGAGATGTGARSAAKKAAPKGAGKGTATAGAAPKSGVKPASSKRAPRKG